MLAFSALVAGSFSLGAQVARDIDPIVVTAVRFFIAAIIVGAVAHASVGLRENSWAAPWRYLVLGGLFAAYFVLMFEGLKTMAAVSGAAVFTLTPLLAAGFGWLVLRQVVTRRMALALVIGAAGALWVIFRGDLAALLRFEIGRGEMIYFLGCVAHALYAPMVARLNRGEPALVFTFGMLVAGFGTLIILGAPSILATDWLALSPLVWITLLYLGVFASAATFVLLQYASLRLPAAKVMAYTYLTPSWVILWEIAIGNQPPGFLVLVGIALTVTALVLLLETEGAERGRAPG